MSNLIINTDGGARGNPGPAGIGVVIVDETGNTLAEMGKKIGVATNNEAEYQAFLLSLEWLMSYPDLNKVQTITWKLDSMLVVKQLQKEWKIKEPRMAALAQQCWQLMSKLVTQVPFKINITHVPREENARADFLYNAALDEK